MPKFENQLTDRVVELPSQAPGVDQIEKRIKAQHLEGEDLKNAKKAAEVLQTKHDRIIARMDASNRWKRVSDSTKVRPPKHFVSTAEEKAKRKAGS